MKSPRDQKPAPNKPVHAKRHLRVLCAFWSLLRDFRRSAADRFVRACARPNRVDRRPLAEILNAPRVWTIQRARASGRRAHSFISYAIFILKGELWMARIELRFV